MALKHFPLKQIDEAHQVIACDGHQPRDGARRWYAMERLRRRGGALPSCRPLRYDFQTAGEPAASQPPPHFGTVSAAAGPEAIEKSEVTLQRTLPRPEDVGPLPADNLPDQLPTLAGPSDDFLDRLVHNAYRIELKGGSLRKQKQPAHDQAVS